MRDEIPVRSEGQIQLGSLQNRNTTPKCICEVRPRMKRHSSFPCRRSQSIHFPFITFMGILSWPRRSILSYSRCDILPHPRCGILSCLGIVSRPVLDVVSCLVLYAISCPVSDATSLRCLRCNRGCHASPWRSLHRRSLNNRSKRGNQLES